MHSERIPFLFVQVFAGLSQSPFRGSRVSPVRFHSSVTLTAHKKRTSGKSNVLQVLDWMLGFILRNPFLRLFSVKKKKRKTLVVAVWDQLRSLWSPNFVVLSFCL